MVDFRQSINQLEIVKFDGSVELTKPGEELFESSVGGGGATGVIVKLWMKTKPLLVYQYVKPQVSPFSSLGDMCETFLTKFYPSTTPLDGRFVVYMIGSGDIFYASQYVAVETSPASVRRFDSSFSNSKFLTWVQRSTFSFFNCFIPDTASFLLRAQLWLQSSEVQHFTSHTIGSHDVLVLPHEEIELHVPRSKALRFAEFFPTAPVPLVICLRLTKSAPEDYVSFNFDSYSPKQWPQMRQFFQSIKWPEDLSQCVTVHPGKGKYVNL